MIVTFDKSFSKSIDKIKDKQVFEQLENTKINLENISSLQEIKSIKKLSGYINY